MQEPQLKQYLFSLLQRREYSEWELRNKLTHLSVDNGLIDRLIDEFKRKDWQSDQRFIESLIRSKKNKHGPLKIKQDLYNKGIDVSTAEYLLPGPEEQIAIAVIILQKKYNTNENTAKMKQKYFSYLYTKGFNSNIIYQAINEFMLSSTHRVNSTNLE